MWFTGDTPSPKVLQEKSLFWKDIPQGDQPGGQKEAILEQAWKPESEKMILDSVLVILQN